MRNEISWLSLLEEYFHKFRKTVLREFNQGLFDVSFVDDVKGFIDKDENPVRFLQRVKNTIDQHVYLAFGVW